MRCGHGVAKVGQLREVDQVGGDMGVSRWVCPSGCDQVGVVRWVWPDGFGIAHELYS